jgi:hypothetical protein
MIFTCVTHDQSNELFKSEVNKFFRDLTVDGVKFLRLNKGLNFGNFELLDVESRLLFEITEVKLIF